MWMFYFPYILSSHTKLFVLFRHLLDSSFLSRPLSSPNSASMPTTLILRFKITHSLSLVLSLPLFLSFTLSISFSLYFRFCFSWLQVRPQADLEVFFPSDLRDGLQGTYANKDVHGRTCSHTHSNTHTQTHTETLCLGPLLLHPCCCLISLPVCTSILTYTILLRCIELNYNDKWEK